MVSERIDEAIYMYINYNQSHWKITVDTCYICSLPLQAFDPSTNSYSSTYLNFATQIPSKLFFRCYSMVKLVKKTRIRHLKICLLGIRIILGWLL